MPVAHEGDDRGAAGQSELAEGVRRAAGDSSARVTSTSRVLPPSNCRSRTSTPTETASSTRAGEQLRGRHGDVDAPGLVEQPVVLRVVDAGDDPGDGELLLGEQRDDEVVLVVAGHGDHDVGLVEVGARAAR